MLLRERIDIEQISNGDRTALLDLAQTRPVRARFDVRPEFGRPPRFETETRGELV